MNSVQLKVGSRETQLVPVHYLRPMPPVIPVSRANPYGTSNDSVSLQTRWVFVSPESQSVVMFKYELYAVMVYHCLSDNGKSRRRRLLVSGSRMNFVTNNTSPPQIEEKWVLMFVGQSRCVKNYLMLILADSSTGEVCPLFLFMSNQ